MPTNQPIRIGLLWHSASSGNLGVGALTVANLAIAREVAAGMGLDAQFVIVGMRDGDTAPVVDSSVAIYTIDRRTLLSPAGYWRTAEGLDCVLDIGAGDSFADIYGPKRFFFIWLTKLLAIARKVPLLLSPQTIGPFTRTPYRQLAAAVMRRATAVVARDRKSLAVVEEMAPGARSLLAVDVAFVLPFDSHAHLRGGQKLRVGINISGLLLHEAETGRNKFGLSLDYARFTRQLLTKLSARQDVEVHLIAHATSGTIATDDDSSAVDRLAAEFPAAIRVPNFAGPSEAKTYISGLDFLVAARMHACIAAFSSGTPVVPVAYSRKFEGLFGMLGYDWTLPVTGLDTEAAVAHCLDAIERRDKLAADEARGMTQVAGLLDNYRAELRRVFAMAVDRRAVRR